MSVNVAGLRSDNAWVLVALGVLLFALPAAAAQDGGGQWWAGLEDMPPGFQVIEVDSVYAISGFTYADILSAMHRNGPGADDVGIRLGVHLSQWRYSYQFSDDGGSSRCRLTEAQVLLRSVIVLPDWTNASTAPPEVASGWRPFLRSLSNHENGHRSRAMVQGVNLWTALLGLEGADCPRLEARVRETADSVLADGREEQRRYDRETGHGASQGATWPE